MDRGSSYLLSSKIFLLQDIKKCQRKLSEDCLMLWKIVWSVLSDVMENCLIRIVWCYGKLSDPYCLMLWKIVWSVCPQKHPSRGVLIKRCSENMQQIYWRKPMPEYDFKKSCFLAWVFSCKFVAQFQNTFS